MVEHLWQVQIPQPDRTGFVLLDAQGYVLKTNLKGQEYLLLFTEVEVANPSPT